MKNTIMWALGSIGSVEAINHVPSPDLITDIFKYLIQIVIAIVSIIKIFQDRKLKKDK